MGEGFNWDEIKEQLKKAVKLEKDEKELAITIDVLEENIEENQMVGGMLKNEEEMKQGLAQFLGKKEPLECNITIDQDERKITMIFEKKKEFKKVYKLLNDIFFGDFLKKMIDAMMQAFQGFASNMEDAFGGMADAFSGSEATLDDDNKEE